MGNSLLLQERKNSDGDGNPGRRPILRRGPRWNVDMQIAFLVKIFRNSKGPSIGSNKGEGRLRGFLHHFSERARQDEPFIPFHLRGFNKEDMASILRPG